MIVAKFGGSSVADLRQIEKVKGIVEADAKRRCIVVSAPGKRSKNDEKITDLLYRCHELAAEGKDFSESFSKIRERFIEIASGLGVTDAGLGADGGGIEKELLEVEGRIAGEKTADYAASRGEYLSARLIAAALGAEFIDAEEVVRLTEDGRVDDASYGLLAARIDKDRDEGRRYVMPGFYGLGPDGKVKTFSRGGSDISGAVFARAVAAEVYENWTDVSGILMADPRIVKDPPPIREVTYSEIREMAFVGANVFHEDAIAPVKSAGIPIHVKNTNIPEAPGTRIVQKRDVISVPIIGVSGKRPYRKISLEKFMLSRHPDLALKIRERVERKVGSCDFELRGFDTLTLFAAEGTVIQEKELVESLIDELGVDGVFFGPKTAVIGIVGEGLRHRADLVGKISAGLSSRSIAIEGVNYGGSPITMTVMVPEGEYEKALDICVEIIGK